MSKKTRPLYAKRSAAYGAMNGFAEERFTGQRTILAYAQEDRVCDDFSEINRTAAEAYQDADGMGMTMGPTVGMISNIINKIFSALAASERVFRLLDEPEEVKDIYGAAELENC